MLIPETHARADNWQLTTATKSPYSWTSLKKRKKTNILLDKKATLVILSPDTLSVMQSVVCDSLSSSVLERTLDAALRLQMDFLKAFGARFGGLARHVVFQTNLIFIRSHTEEWYEESNFATAADLGFQLFGSSRI
jgi:hypothetical protein